jgi:hypothetical protein
MNVPPSPQFRKSTYSNQGNCVEVAVSGASILLRDSKNCSGPILTLGKSQFNGFLSALRAGRFGGDSSAV